MENIKSETTGQKRIDTIATDIKNLVAGISNGKPANVTEAVSYTHLRAHET